MKREDVLSFTSQRFIRLKQTVGYAASFIRQLQPTYVFYRSE